ncbi:FUSC family protein [Microcystis sp. M_OC_Ca_00000000_S217Cul]|uniref:FUSC family protein n=1 Tax=Microcystis sp. M_OC_Ca_00000000_S217Cul TaxID=2486214 RepID=UPI00257D5B51|nr:FUSC family protein [Microcystis sp. M_OC_Ca_00000000_S217Cul]
MDSKNGLMIRQGLKFSLGAALLTSFFWHRGNVLDNFVYPVFGYVSVLIEPSMGGAIAAGLGRLGGSALGGIIAAILVNAYGIQGSSFFVIPSLTYILAALICETYRWQAAYSQATLLGALIAMRVVGTSAQQDIWLYLRSRLIDNWIGIAVGIAVALLFWPQNTRSDLNRNLMGILQDIPRLFQKILDRHLKTEVEERDYSLSIEQNELNLLNQIKKSTQTSLSMLTKATHEFGSEILVAENWSEILAIQNQLTRQLADLMAFKGEKHEQNLVGQFRAEFYQLATHLTDSFDSLRDLSNAKKILATPYLRELEEDLGNIGGKLDHLRTSGEINRYDVQESLQFYQFIQLVSRFIQQCEGLGGRIIDKTKVTATFRRRHLITFPKWAPIPLKRLREIVSLGLVIGLLLAIIRHIEFPYPSAYEKVADIVVVGAVVTVIQPTRGRAIAIGWAATVSLSLTILCIYLLVKSFGYNPFSSSLAYFFAYFSCAWLGFTPIARIGAIVAADAIGKDIFPFFEQGIWAALISVPVGAFLGVLLTTVFMTKSATNQLETDFSVTFKKMGQLYQKLLSGYFQDTIPPSDIAQLKQAITVAIAQHPASVKIASLEQISTVLATKHQNFWNFCIGYEQKLWAQLDALQDGLQQPLPEPIRQKFLPELQAIAQQTAIAFDEMAEAIAARIS